MKRSSRGHKQLAAALALAEGPGTPTKPMKACNHSPHKTPPDRIVKPLRSPPQMKRPLRFCKAT